MRRTTVLITLIVISLLSLETGVAQRRDQRFNAPDFFQVRAETHLGCRTQEFSYASGDVAACFSQGMPEFQMDLVQAVKLPGKSKGFVDMPKAASRFVAERDATVVAITFSAMNYVGTVDDEPLIVRALVDGQEAEPGPITLTAGFDTTRIASQSFTFTTTVNKGIHIVQMQWSSEATAASSFLRNASLFVAVDSQDNAGQRVAAKGGKLNTLVTKSDKSWTAIPQAEVNFNVPESGEVALTFSSVLKMNQGDFILLRAVIDDGGVLAAPVETALAARAYHSWARSVTFTANEIKAGAHKVRFEWRSSLTEVVASATLEAWSVTALTGPRQTTTSFFDSVPQTALANTTSPTFAPVPTLATSVTVDELSDVAVTFSAAFGGPGVILATVTKDGVAMNEQEVVLHSPEIQFANLNSRHPIVFDAGAQSYTFALKDLAPRDSPYQIGVAYRVLQAGVTTSASGSVSDGTLTVLRKRRLGPDLAVGANMGRTSKEREAIIEPVHGTRKIVVIIFDPDRPDAPEPDRIFRSGIESVLFGEAPSAADYYRAVSGGRFNLEEVAVLGPYKGDKAGGETGRNHYWDNQAHDPNGDGECDDSIDEFSSPFAEQQAEALQKASAEFDFSKYDLDRNGIIAPSELGIIIVTPQSNNFGNTVVSFDPFCGEGNPLLVNGVEIRYFTHIYTPGIIAAPDKDDPDKPAKVRLGSAMLAAHELAHLFLGLDDAYGPVEGLYQGADVQIPCPDKNDPACQTRFINTSPHPTSMMTYKTPGVDSSPHLDGFHKLQLGWVTPKIIVEAGDYNLLEARQSKEVLILPRRGADGREYVLLETRFQSSQVNDPLYDFGILDSGLAVYHVIEPGLACQAQAGASLPDCVLLRKPMCITSGAVWDSYRSNFLRPGLRLIQPDLTHGFNTTNSFGNTLFGNDSGEVLLDESAGGSMVCPLQIGDPLPAGGVPLLLWVDGTASGYRLKAITLDNEAKKTLFKVEINGQ